MCARYVQTCPGAGARLDVPVTSRSLRMRFPHLSAALLAAVFAASNAGATEPHSPAGAPAQATTLAALPEAVRDLLERRYGEMADPGGPFSRWCQREPGSFHARLVAAELRPDHVLVHFEHGSRGGARKMRAEYRRSGDDWSEAGNPAAPPARWAGGQREFSPVLDAGLPLLWKPGSD